MKKMMNLKMMKIVFHRVQVFLSLREVPPYSLRGNNSLAFLVVVSATSLTLIFLK